MAGPDHSVHWPALSEVLHTDPPESVLIVQRWAAWGRDQSVLITSHGSVRGSSREQRVAKGGQIITCKSCRWTLIGVRPKSDTI